jgi:hypothetical protein
MRLLLLILCLTLIAIPVAAGGTSPEGTAPIYVLNGGGIYAVSPIDGRVETLVAAPTNYADFFSEYQEPTAIFDADWLSPDGQYLAYRTYARDPQHPDQVEMNPRRAEVHVVDVRAGGAPINVPLFEAGASEISDLAWSADGQALYVAALDAGLSGEYLLKVERGAWAVPSQTARVPLQPDATGRHVYATDFGAVIMDFALQSPHYDFVYQNFETGDQRSYQVDYDLSPDVNLSINTPFTPLVIDERLRYGLVNWLTGELLYSVDLETGEVTPMSDHSYFPGMLANAPQAESLHVSSFQFNGVTTELMLRDADSNIVGTIDDVYVYGFGMQGDGSGSAFALSPDGQSLAYLSGVRDVEHQNHPQIMIWHDGEVTPLNVVADALAWGPVYYATVFDPAWLAG